jgi:hypothetical protein
MTEDAADRTPLGTRRRVPASEPALPPIPDPPPIHGFFTEEGRRYRLEHPLDTSLRCATPEEEEAFRKEKEREAADQASPAKRKGCEPDRPASGDDADDEPASPFRGGRAAAAQSPLPDQDTAVSSPARKAPRRGVIGRA